MGQPRIRVAALVTLALLVAGCRAAAEPAAPLPPDRGATAPGSAPGNASDEWEQVVAAAKREGKVVVAGPAGAAQREAILRFAEFYPGIQVEYASLTGRNVSMRVLSERQAGQYHWDVHVGGVNSAFTELIPHGVLDPIRPVIRPELQRDDLWYGGFEFGWADLAKQYAYMFVMNAGRSTFVNRDVISPEQFSHHRQLIDPRWKGKIAIDDPTGTGAGGRQFAILITAYGDEFGRKLLKDQEAVITREKRQLTEWVVRGRYPIGIGGVDGGDLVIFQEQGIGLNVQGIESPETTALSSSNGAVMLFNRPAHPNAAKVLVNWLLSKESGEIWAKTQQNSRRTDVAPGVPEEFPDPAELHRMVRNDEAWEPVRQRAQQVAKEAVGY
jgi:iron(III) transport system substrate-binding protein